MNELTVEEKERAIEYARRVDAVLAEFQMWAENEFEKWAEKEKGIKEKVKVKVAQAKVKGLRMMIVPFREAVKETIENHKPEETEAGLRKIVSRLLWVLEA